VTPGLYSSLREISDLHTPKGGLDDTATSCSPEFASSFVLLLIPRNTAQGCGPKPANAETVNPRKVQKNIITEYNRNKPATVDPRPGDAIRAEKTYSNIIAMNTQETIIRAPFVPPTIATTNAAAAATPATPRAYLTDGTFSIACVRTLSGSIGISAAPYTCL
jgi:hypothetical protein